MSRGKGESPSGVDTGDRLRLELAQLIEMATHIDRSIIEKRRQMGLPRYPPRSDEWHAFRRQTRASVRQIEERLAEDVARIFDGGVDWSDRVGKMRRV